MTLTDFQKRLINALQSGLPVCHRPFAEVAKVLGADEQKVLEYTAEFKKTGIIRRLRAMINYRALGFSSTLVTGHVPDSQLDAVTQTVNNHPGVSHNYLREHHYNMWFTLQMPSELQVEATLLELGAQYDITFHSLPVIHFFKLDVRFDAEDEEKVLLEDNETVQGMDKLELSDSEILVLSKLQQELEITSEPFAHMTCDGLTGEQVFGIIEELQRKGVIRRIAGVVNHRKLGLVANAMFVANVSQHRIVEAGRNLARTGHVSHCYERKIFDGWPYNLFGMMHGRDMENINRATEIFVNENSIKDYQLLGTVRELKKQPIRYKIG